MFKSTNRSADVEIVYGFRAWLIHQKLKLYFFWIILGINRNPFNAIREVKGLQRLRNTLHGNNRITKFVKSGKKYFWVTNLPSFPSVNIRKMIRNELMRIRDGHDTNRIIVPQQTIFWGITNRCPLSCRHCYEWDNIDNRDYLTRAQLFEILEKIEQQGLWHVQLSGGEPLARFDDLLAIVKKASSRIDFWILTSGYGLTEEKALLLKKAGLIGVMVSLDHWDATHHNDFRRNPKSFEWASKAVSNCNKAGLLTGLSLCATREFVTEENLERYAHIAKEWRVHFLRILEPRQTGKFAGQKVALESKSIESIIQFVIKLNNNAEYKNYPIATFPGLHQRRLGCLGAGNRYFYIDATGDVHACPFCQNKVGSALYGSLPELIERLSLKGCQAFKTA